MAASGVCISPSVGAAPQTFSAAINFFAAAQCLVSENWPPDAKVSCIELKVVSNEPDDRHIDVVLCQPETNVYILSTNKMTMTCSGVLEKFDFIIVGAGSAGSVVANRLSEVSSWNVLLIEAGADPPVESIIPSMDSAIFGTEYDWKYSTVNDGRTNAGNIDGNCLWPRGKMLGGCSSINAMIYIRGNSHDYQRWYDEGNREWHPDVVDKYFRKAENLQDFTTRNSPEGDLYGHDGPLDINVFNVSNERITEDILRAWDDIGIRTVRDVNGPEPLGAGIVRVTATNGTRESTAKAYLNSVRDRKNLKVMKNSLAVKILISPLKRALGVRVERNGKKRDYFATKEVIISAGTVNTPQLLMLSGIGPKKHLSSLKINNLVDLPVGQNLQDHIIIPITIYARNDTVAAQDTASYDFDVIKYLNNRTGSLASGRLLKVTALYAKSNDAPYPLYQNHVVIFPKNSSNVRKSYSNMLRYKDEVADSVSDLNENHTLYQYLFTLLHPKSRGNISLQSTDPKVHPLIYANYFKEPTDLTDTVEGIKILTNVINSTYFKSVGGFLGRIRFGPCDELELGSDEYWKCVSVNLVRTIYHPVGTAKMGVSSKDSVVDGRLRVHGVRNLRVVDASVMPVVTSGNTNGPVIMIGERASDLIKGDYKERIFG